MPNNTTTYDNVILGTIPEQLRTDLLNSYNKIARNFREGRWEPSELNGGKLCEVAYTILRGYFDGSFPATSSKPRNMVDACRALEQESSSTFSRSLRIQIPRMLMALYEIRNNRGVGHVGGDVDPNQMDAVAVLYMSKWIIAELIRVFHNVDIETAASLVDSIVERILPIVWKVNGKLRILKTTLTMKEKTLILLYNCAKPVQERDLVDWLEHSNPSAYRRDILKKAHKEKLIEYNGETRSVQISPKGIRFVEESVNLDDY